jgi:hypothetical protein
MKGAVVVHYDERGEVTFHVYGDDSVRLYIVDERCPNDRVYEWLSREAPDAFKEMIGDSPIGSSADDRHGAVKNLILSSIAGRPHLKPVD